MTYAPGSFSKNFAWHGTGLLKLHTAIREGYRNTVSPVDRQAWRRECGALGELDLIPVNFFLHNKDGQMSVDALVYQTIKRPHTIAFDRLGLFAFHLNRAGSGRDTRSGRVIQERPAMWANEFVRERLWSAGTWQRDALLETNLDSFLEDRMEAQQNVRLKCRTNYQHIFELCDHWPSALPVINTGVERWMGSALFLAWDRSILDGGATDRNSLLDLIRTDELYKLLGVTEEYAIEGAENLADLYVSAGNLARFSGEQSIVSLPEIDEETETEWIDQQESDQVVGRRAVATLVQVRDRRKAAALRQHYDNTCMFCGVKLQVSEESFYSEAAHIKPLGQPHNGPDKVSNMLVLCPNHHLQFDRGILHLRWASDELHLMSKIPDDPLHGTKIPLNHSVDQACVDWHEKWFRSNRA